jgi:hypothetical protein
MTTRPLGSERRFGDWTREQDRDHSSTLRSQQSRQTMTPRSRPRLFVRLLLMATLAGVALGAIGV